MKTVYTHFSNHFDLLWRRCWDREYDYEGGRYASYRHIEMLCMARNLALAEAGDGAYAVEQAHTVRAYLADHPEDLARLQALYKKGLFEMLGSGEAIIDVNMCGGETMVRNLASGVWWCREVLGMPPLLACHNDGFGSSAQFPQAIRGCGLPGIWGMSYGLPDNLYWRGLDGSTVLAWPGAKGQTYFYDHCYHEPCRVCLNRAREGCAACEGTGLDLPQNYYPPFAAMPAEGFQDGLAHYHICSEEMLPLPGFTAQMRGWEAASVAAGEPVRYVWGTQRHLAPLWQPLAALVDDAPADKLASRMENNPVQTGCLVSRIRIKQRARLLEATLYGWEKALMLSTGTGARLDRARWEALFLELPLAFFHDSVTGTHQDPAYQELMDRMAAAIAGVGDAARSALGDGGATVQGGAAGAGAATNATVKAGATVSVFAPHATAGLPATATLPPVDWRSATPLVAVDAQGGRHPVVLPLHATVPVMPLVPGRRVNSIGADTRCRPDGVAPRLTIANATPLAWTALRLEAAAAPMPITGRTLRNAAIEVTLGDDGVTAVRDLATGHTAQATALSIGELLLEEDEGDPWGTRKLSAFRHGMRPYTALLGAARFDGYQEAWYGGRFEPNLRFGREADPKIFSLEWLVTVRLLDAADEVEFSYEVFWKSSDRRVRVAFPVQAPTDTAWYSIPAGWLERARYEQTETALWSPNGDWPALNWVAAQGATPTAPGWALVNHGTPAARVEDGAILASVLRSPGFGHCLERYAQAYPMPTSGIRDGGWHHFHFALRPHGGAASLPALAVRGAAANTLAPYVLAPATQPAPAPAAVGWRLDGAGIELQAAKPAFDPTAVDAVVLRLVNHHPTTAPATLHLPPGCWRVHACDLIETLGAALPVAEGTVALTLGGFEIRSLHITPV